MPDKKDPPRHPEGPGWVYDAPGRYHRFLYDQTTGKRTGYQHWSNGQIDSTTGYGRATQPDLTKPLPGSTTENPPGQTHSNPSSPHQDGAKKFVGANGNVTYINPDGTWVTYDKYGNVTREGTNNGPGGGGLGGDGGRGQGGQSYNPPKNDKDKTGGGSSGGSSGSSGGSSGSGGDGNPGRKTSPPQKEPGGGSGGGGAYPPPVAGAVGVKQTILSNGKKATLSYMSDGRVVEQVDGGNQYHAGDWDKKTLPNGVTVEPPGGYGVKPVGSDGGGGSFFGSVGKGVGGTVGSVGSGIDNAGKTGKSEWDKTHGKDAVPGAGPGQPPPPPPTNPDLAKAVDSSTVDGKPPTWRTNSGWTDTNKGFVGGISDALAAKGENPDDVLEQRAGADQSTILRMKDGKYYKWDVNTQSLVPAGTWGEDGKGLDGPTGGGTTTTQTGQQTTTQYNPQLAGTTGGNSGTETVTGYPPQSGTEPSKAPPLTPNDYGPGLGGVTNPIAPPTGGGPDPTTPDPIIPSGTGCFPAGTMVLTPTGQQLIEQLKPGDLVSAWSMNLKQLVPSKITQMFKHKDNQTIKLETAAGSVTTTSAHRFWTGDSWIPAGKLTPGHSMVQDKDGKLHKVLAITDSTTQDVYNFHVDHPDHNYFAQNLLVHNVKADP